MEEHDRTVVEHKRMTDENARDLRAANQTLRRAIAGATRGACAERRKRRELDDKITQLSSAQLVTEEKLERFIDSLRRGGNGTQS